MSPDIQPYLKSELVEIRPLASSDYLPLFKVASDPLIWEQHHDKARHTPNGFALFFEESMQSKGALCILDVNNSQIIGSSRFKIIDISGKVVEIGWTFLKRDYWGGKYNREIKRLMIKHALNWFKRVIFYVNANNLRSQGALAKLGAKNVSALDLSWVLDENEGLTFLIKEEIQ
ncbi:MAG: GNAT family N-acetyltransferase [Flavobacteriaceae bacterium]